MQCRAVSSLIVIHRRKLRGIVTEKDLVTRVLSKSADPEALKVSEVMNRAFTLLEEAIRMMLTQSIKKLPRARPTWRMPALQSFQF